MWKSLYNILLRSVIVGRTVLLQIHKNFFLIDKSFYSALIGLIFKWDLIQTL